MADPHSPNTSPTFNLRASPATEAQRAVQPAPPVAPSSLWITSAGDDGPPTQSGGVQVIETRNSMPDVVAGYEILSELGRGGMGVVYRARHHRLKRVVALKLSLSACFACTEELVRFRLEGETAASLQHPNIVGVYEVGSHEGQPYMVLEYVEGGTLAGMMRERTPSTKEAATLTEVLARAVHVAHSRGIIHRDLKPANVLMADGSVPKITDFGLAKHLDRAGGLTETGRVLGTPEYMAPEQAAGQSNAIGPAVDVYALGAILYEMLAGQPPFRSTAGVDTLLQVVMCEAVPPRRLRAGIPRDLETICLRCLDKEPGRRYASAADLADDVRRFQEGRPILARPVGAIERIWKWSRRRPVVAGLLAALVLISLLGITGVTAALLFALRGWDLAAQEKLKAEEERETARRERSLALEAEAREAAQRHKAEANLSFSLLAQAAQLCRDNMLTECEACLDQIEPARRGWEWRYLDGLHRREARSLSHPWQAIVKGVAFSPDGKYVAGVGGNPYIRATAAYPGCVAIWETATGNLVRVLDGFREMTGVVAYSPDGKSLAAGCRDRKIRIWDSRSGRLLRTLTSPGAGVLENFAWSPDGRQLAGASHEGGTIVWDMQSGKALHTLNRGKGVASYVAWSGDGHYLACVHARVELWEMPAARPVRLLDHGADALAFSRDGRVLACARGSIVHLYAIPEVRLMGTLGGHTGRVSDVSFSADGLLLATGSADSTVRIWSVEDSRQLSLWRGHRGRVECVAFHPAGHMVASGSAQPGDVRLWDLTRQQESSRIPHSGNGNWTDALAFVPAQQGPAGSHRFDVIIQRRYGNVEVCDPFSGLRRSTRKLPIHNNWRTPATMGAFSGDVRTLVSIDGKDNRLVRAWATVSGKALTGSCRHDMPVWQLSLCEDGKLAASAAQGVGRDSFVSECSIWDTSTGKVFWHKKDRNLRVLAMQISSDGHWLARSVIVREVIHVQGGPETRIGHCTVELWAVPGPGQPAPSGPSLALATGTRDVFGLAFRSDNKVLAAASHSRGAFLWDLPEGKPVHARWLPGPPALEGLAYHPDGRLLAGVSRMSVIVWDAIEGQQVASLSGAPPRSGDAGFSPHVAWSPDGRLLAATNWDHSVSVWDGADQSDPAIREEIQAGLRQRLPAWHLENAERAWNAGRRQSSELHLELLKKLEPLEPGWELERGRLLARMGEWNRAAAVYSRALADNSAHPPQRWLEHALLQARMGNVAICRDAAEHMVTQFGHDAEPITTTYAVLAATVLPGGTKEPQELVRMAIGSLRRPGGWTTTSFPLHSLAMAYLRAGRHDATIATVRESMETNPSWGLQEVLNWLTLALAYKHLGHKEQARPWWEKAKSRLAEEEKMLAESKRPYPLSLAWVRWLWIRQLYAETAEVMGK